MRMIPDRLYSLASFPGSQISEELILRRQPLLFSAPFSAMNPPSSCKTREEESRSVRFDSCHLRGAACASRDPPSSSALVGGVCVPTELVADSPRH